MKINWKKLILSLVICFGVAWLGSAATTPKISSWYAELNKPFFSPPNWLFGPVWTLLYLLMAISLYREWKKRDNLFDKYFRWFWIQLGLNCLWSWAFFGWENPGIAIVIILSLWWSIKKFRENFSYQLPYQLWVSFASILNIAVWWLNR